ncbi:hypothetical protein MtrunA17_Chr2g0277931 [Medicago truncatula]|uniref:Transmembrane protein n=1 Tax=Medicago truncatula TaxID=3880 RepID=A0A396J0J0_MEDTR|nr:hypothetical protein MtrunA17_Chr2g0277931 [Medicago truncatula]
MYCMRQINLKFEGKKNICQKHVLTTKRSERCLSSELVVGVGALILPLLICLSSFMWLHIYIYIYIYIYTYIYIYISIN